MRRRAISLAVLICLASSAAVHAQGDTTSQGRRNRTALWTGIGAGAGFGAGLWVGLHVFDDAVNSDRKIWTTAIGTAIAGAVVAHLLARPRQNSAARPSRSASRGSAFTRTSGTLFELPIPVLRPGASTDWREFRAAIRRYEGGVDAARTSDGR